MANPATRPTIAHWLTWVSQYPDVGAVVLECTNMPPYAAALQASLGVPVFDVYSLVTWFRAGVRPRQFGSSD